MAKATLQGMILRGIVACVPPREVVNDQEYPWFSSVEIRKVTSMAGIRTRHHADPDVCTSDLCHAAAEELLRKLHWSSDSVDALLLVTQTPDYVMPSTSCLLQHRLGLSQECAAFDVGLGCSAYIYGLWLANALIGSGAARRILLLTGETPSKLVDVKDRATALLFGDAGTATALEASTDVASAAHYILRTDGADGDALIVPGGMFRHRFPAQSRDLCLQMDGMRLFEFTRQRIPVLINDLLQLAQRQVDEYAYFVFHQANEYMIRFLATKAGVDMRKVPLALDQFGNTGAASVPLTLAVTGPPASAGERYPVMLVGFGVGLSWGAVSMTIPSEAIMQNIVYTAR